MKKVGRVFGYIVLAIGAFLSLFPFYFMFVSGTNTNAQILSVPPKLTIGTELAKNFAILSGKIDLLQSTWNTLFISVVYTVLALLLFSAAGYALAKFEFKGKNVILTVVLSLLVLPLESILLSLFFIVNKLGWVDSYLALIIPFIVKCFDVYLFRQFFLDVPDDLIEAAEIDGAGPFKTFLQVIIPVSKPVFATVFILDYVAYWSDFMWPLLVITDAGKRTVQLGIQTFFTEPPVYYGPIMAALTIASVPMIIMFLFLQKYYVQGISTSGIKG